MPALWNRCVDERPQSPLPVQWQWPSCPPREGLRGSITSDRARQLTGIPSDNVFCHTQSDRPRVPQFLVSILYCEWFVTSSHYRPWQSCSRRRTGGKAEARLRKCTPWQVRRRYCQADVDSSTTLRMTFLRPASAALFGRPLRPTAHEYPSSWRLLSTPDLSAGSRNTDVRTNMSRSTTPKSFVAETHTSPKSMNHKEEGDGNSHSHN